MLAFATGVRLMRVRLLLVALLAGCSAGSSGDGGSSTGGGGGTGGGIATGGGGGCVPNVAGAPGLTITSNGADAGALLVSDPIDVRATGFAGCSTVHFDFRLGGDSGFQASADFATNAAGTADTRTDAPVSGPWAGVDPDGPLWSMQGPYVSLTDFDLIVDASDDAGHVAHQTASRTVLPPGTTVTPISTNGLVATLYRPPGAGPFAAVLTFGGSEGGIAGGDLMAKGLVGEGVVTMSLAYFGTGALPNDLHLIPLEYFETALDVLRSQSFVRADRVAVMGASRGGEAALLVGATFPSKVAATIAVVPSGYVWPAWGYWTSSSWTYGGNPLAFVPWSNASELTVDDGGMQLVYQNVLFSDSLQQATGPQLSAAQIAIEAAQGPVLLLASSEDGVWPSCPMAQVAWDRLTAAGHPAQWPLDSFTCFMHTGHGLNPVRAGWPVGNTLYAPAGGGTYEAGGGDAPDTAHADRQARALVHALLEQLRQ